MYFLHVETTGLKVIDGHLMWEIGVSGTEKEFSSFIACTKVMPPHLQRAFNIRQEQLSPGLVPSEAQVLRGLLAFIGKDETATIAGSNGKNFAFPFLYSAFERHNMKIPAGWTFIDTVEEMRLKDGPTPRKTYSYRALARDYGIVYKYDTTRALPVARLIREIFRLHARESRQTLLPFRAKRAASCSESSLPPPKLQRIAEGQ